MSKKKHRQNNLNCNNMKKQLIHFIKSAIRCMKSGVVLNWTMIIIAILTWSIADKTYDIAERTYRLSAGDFGMRMTIDKVDEFFKIRNKDTDLFKIDQVTIDKTLCYRYTISDKPGDYNRRDIYLTIYDNHFQLPENNSASVSRIKYQDNLDEFKVGVEAIYDEKTISDTDAINSYNQHIDYVNRKIVELEVNESKTEYLGATYLLMIRYYNKETFTREVLHIRIDEDKNAKVQTPIPISGRIEWGKDHYIFKKHSNDMDWDAIKLDMNNRTKLFNEILEKYSNSEDNNKLSDAIKDFLTNSE